MLQGTWRLEEGLSPGIQDICFDCQVEFAENEREDLTCDTPE
jgi:hypothetical protein